MNLRCRFLPSVSLFYVAVIALAVIERFERFAIGQVFWGVVFLAVSALAPTRVAASIQGPLLSMQQSVVGVVRAYDKVAGGVVGSDAIDVVNFFGAFQIPTKSAFGYQDVLSDVPTIVGLRMFGGGFAKISTPAFDDTALPVSVEAAASSRSTSQQNRAPNVCADNATNLTHSGGFRG